MTAAKTQAAPAICEEPEPIDEINLDIEEIEKAIQELKYTVRRIAGKLAASGTRRARA